LKGSMYYIETSLIINGVTAILVTFFIVGARLNGEVPCVSPFWFHVVLSCLLQIMCVHGDMTENPERFREDTQWP
jgi:hypothetical protein